MEMKMIGKERDRISFSVKDTTPAFMNTMRRLIIDETPTMAVKTVNFVKNTSALYDEMIAHRMGLVVLKTDLEGYELPENCKCEGKGCARCTIDITLQVDGPGVVYAEAMKIKNLPWINSDELFMSVWVEYHKKHVRLSKVEKGW